MPNLVIDGEVHPLNVDHSTLLDGFMVECPVCSKAWAHMPPIGCRGLVYSVAFRQAPCPEHGGNVLDLVCNHILISLPIRYGYAPRSLLLQAINSVKE